MRRPAFAVLLACCAIFSAVLPASARAQGVPTAPSAAALPAAAFGTVPAIDNVTLSLDGKLLASAYVGDQVSIAILDLVARKPRHRIAFDQTMKLRSMGFVDDTTLLVAVDHVLFRSAYIQDAKAIERSAHPETLRKLCSGRPTIGHRAVRGA